MQKIKSLIGKCTPIPQKIYNITKKRLRTPNEGEKYFPGFHAFIDCTEQQSRYQGSRIIKERRNIILLERKRHMS
jgi:hypothetical protein